MRGRRLRSRCEAPRGGLACGGWRPALGSDIAVLRDELASLSPCGDERAAGLTFVFFARARFEFSCSRVFIATFGRRGRPSSLRLRVTCCRINLRPYRPAATSVLQGLPAFYRSGTFCVLPAFLSSRLAFGAGGVGYDTAGRAAVGICVGRRDAKAPDGGVFGS